MRLRIILEPSDEGGYTVIVPALPGCISEGDTREDALKNIQEAIALYLEPIEDDYDPLWEVTFKLLDNIEETEEQIQKILETHHIELQEVMQEIKDKEEEYK